MNTIAALIMGAAAAALVTALLGLAIIPWLRKLHFGQTILEIGPKWHEKKQGTPTMGGLMFIFGTIAAVAVTVITDKLLGGDIVDSSATGASIIELYTKFYSGIIFALSVALIGFADDSIWAWARSPICSFRLPAMFVWAYSSGSLALSLSMPR